MNDRYNRAHIRVPLKFEIKYIQNGDYIVSFNKNISIDGIFICTPNPMPEGHYLTLNFSIGELENLEIGAMVVWINTTGSIENHGMGLQFTDPPPEHLKETIINHVKKINVFQEATNLV